MVNDEPPWSSDDNISTTKQDGPLRPQRKDTAVVKVARSRFVLHLQAQMWRFLMSIGMFLHRLAPPHPPKPAFSRTITAKLSGKPGLITLYFYTPLGYDTQKSLWKDQPLEQVGRRRSVISQVGGSFKKRNSQRKWGSYPVVINFHGGGFTLGTAGDDSRWLGTVVSECDAVVVSVDYRLAPEHPFPTAVEDGADAVVWVHQNAQELGIDRQKIALSGFSSGGNMAFTVPLRLHDETTNFERHNADAGRSQAQATSSTAPVDADSEPRKQRTRVTTQDLNAMSEISIRATVAWYPSLDYTRSREVRRQSSKRKDQDLSALFTELFDESYLHPPDTDLSSPYLSPGVAPDALLRDGLPQDIILHTCEWDMLLEEGEVFHKRLIAPPLNKKVVYKMIPEVPHGFDKAPNPLKPTPGVKEHYLRACKELRRVFNARSPEIEDGLSIPRRSTQLVR